MCLDRFVPAGTGGSRGSRPSDQQAIVKMQIEFIRSSCLVETLSASAKCDLIDLICSEESGAEL